MAKALKIAAIVATVAAVTIVTGGAALGLGLSLSTGIAGFATAGQLLLAGTLLSAGASLLSPKPKAPDTSAANAQRLQVQIDVRAPRKIIVGTTAMATDLRDQESSSDGTYLHRFLVVASHRVNAIREIWFDDKLAWTAAGGAQGDYARWLQVTPVLEGSAGNAINIGSRMGSSRRFTGLAYVYLRYTILAHSKKLDSPFAQSIPSRVTIIGDGASFYDPRLDSTVPGGSGAMRADDQSTWGWNESACRNPVLAMLFYLLGWRINGKLAVGKGIPANRIDLASFITAANLCDEPVTIAAGGTEPRYRCDGIFSEADDPQNVLDNLKAACNAILDDMDGRIRVTVLHNDLATPIGELTTADVIGAFTWNQTPALSDCINVIRGGYTDPSTTSLYQLVDGPEVRIDSVDGIDRTQTVNLPVVESPSQWERLVKQRVQRMAFGGTFSAVFQATAWKFQKGDLIRFSFFPLGWSRKPFRIAEMTVQVDGTVPLLLREEDPAIYAHDDSNGVAIVGAPPASYDPANWPLLLGITEAGTTAEWGGVSGPGKPADDATNSADPASPFGPGTVGAALGMIEKVPVLEQRFVPIESNVSALTDAKVGHDRALDVLGKRLDPAERGISALALASADQGAVQRQAARAVGRIDEALLRNVMESARTRDILRDAGIVVDPANGTVRIYAIDQLRDRTTTAEQSIDAVKGVVSTKVSLDQMQEAIAAAVLDPSQVAELEPIIRRLTEVEQLADANAALVQTRASITELTALGGRVKTAEQSIDALNGAIASKVDVTVVQGLNLRLGAAEQILSAVPGLSTQSVMLRQARGVADDAATAALRGMVAGDSANRYQLTQLAQARQEITTALNDGLSSAASATLALSARTGATEAALVQTSKVLSDVTGAYGSRLDSLELLTGDPVTGLAATRVRINDVVDAYTKADEALGRRVDVTEAAVSDPVIGLPATRAEMVRSLDALAKVDAATTRRIDEMVAEISDPNTGLPATLAKVISNAEAQVRTDKAQTDRIDAQGVTLKDQAATVARLDSAAIDAAGGIAGTTMTIRQIVGREGKTGEALLRGLLAGDEANRARLAQMVQVQTEFSTSLVANEAANAVARQSLLVRMQSAEAAIVDTSRALATTTEALTKRIQSAEAVLADPVTGLAATRARLIREEELRSDADKATGKSLDLLTVSVNDPNTGLPGVSASVAKLAETTAKADEANAKLIEQVRVKLGDLGEATVSDLIEAVVKSTGEIMATRTIAIDINGNVVGTQLVGSPDGPGSLNLINADLRLGTGRIVKTNGVYMAVEGIAFGAQRDLLEWYGPTMAIDQCSRANALEYKGTDGSIYTTASLSAGTLRNGGASSSLAADALAEVPAFGSNGRPVRYACSWSYQREYTLTYEATSDGRRAFQADVAAYNASSDDGFTYFGAITAEQPQSLVTLKRAFAGQAAEQLGQRGFTTQTRTMNGLAPTLGDAAGYATFTSTIGGGLTVLDPVQTTTPRTLRLALARGFTIGDAGVVQRLTIVSVEE